MMNKRDLVKTRFAKIVKEAYENGDLNPYWIGEWVTKYNGGRYDEILYKEVEFLISYFNGKTR